MADAISIPCRWKGCGAKAWEECRFPSGGLTHRTHHVRVLESSLKGNHSGAVDVINRILQQQEERLAKEKEKGAVVVVDAEDDDV